MNIYNFAYFYLLALGLTSSVLKTADNTYQITAYQVLSQAEKNKIHWDWSKIDTSKINGIPIENFFANIVAARATTDEPWLFGTGTSAYQIEENCKNNWSEFIESHPELGKQPAGDCCKGVTHALSDVKLMSDIGMNSYRFSVEWSKINPEPGVFDQAELDRYEMQCKELVKAGIKPYVTLFHYTEPVWFYNKGSFERKENIQYFVDFCAKVFEQLHPYVHLWGTFCSFEGYAFPGWLTGEKPPAKKDPILAGRVLKNTLEAHVAVYKKLKSMPGGQESKIGFYKTIMQLDPASPYNPLDRAASYMGSRAMGYTIYNFFKTGVFDLWIPGKVTMKEPSEYLQAGEKFGDFISLSYYCHNYISFFNLSTRKLFYMYRDPQEVPTANDRYTIYGEGLYRALKELDQELSKPCNLPIYVVENGIGTNNDEYRTLFFQRYLFALGHAIADGIDVRGYAYWSLMDNNEWGRTDKCYGLYATDYNHPGKTRTLKPSAYYYINLVKAALGNKL
ncbi:family 1 glycosylhydrolase [Vermiphilus pyriformis]|nr:MAG: family 1 glycosylhydrolase [Vermiphilus pyriformis]